MSEKKLDLIVKGLLEREIKTLEKIPQIYPLVNRRIAEDLFSLDRIFGDERLLLLGLHFMMFRIPFERYGNRLLRKKLRESELPKRLKDREFTDGEVASILSMLDELNMRTTITSMGQIDEGDISKTLDERIRILRDEGKIRSALWEIIGTLKEEVPTIGREMAGKLIGVYKELIEASKRGWDALRKSIEDYTIKFDRLLTEEFGF